MDMRMGGSYYEELYMEAQEKYSISFIRGKVSEIGVNIEKRLIAKVEDTLAGRPLRMELDLMVLMVGMEISESGSKLAKNSGLKVGVNRFLDSADGYFGTNRSEVEGIFYAGTCTAPMSIPETISHARAAALEVVNYMKKGKHRDE
jgi:heterodisulfide reductase subunit A